MEANILAAILTLATKYGQDPILVTSMVQVESGFRPNAIGYKVKERGLLQLHPKFFPEASFEPWDNLEIGIKYLTLFEKRCKLKYGEAWFTCYNVGPNSKKPSLEYFKKVTDGKKSARSRIRRYLLSSQSKNCEFENFSQGIKRRHGRVCFIRKYDLFRQFAKSKGTAAYSLTRASSLRYSPYIQTKRRRDMRSVCRMDDKTAWYN